MNPMLILENILKHIQFEERLLPNHPLTDSERIILSCYERVWNLEDWRDMQKNIGNKSIPEVQ